MSLIKKYASPLSLLAVIMAIFAAPYLIPENPDSTIFRSGTLGLILLLGCYYPVKESLRRANSRQLSTSLIFGYCFALALSLGSELFIYDGLLRGFGSFVRRMAVPVLAAPLFGCLCCPLTMVSTSKKASRFPKLPVWGYAMIFFLCWLPLLMAYYPGMLNYDFPSEYRQHLESSYSNAHPLLHSVLINSTITLGEMLHSRTFGVLLYSLLQMGIFSLSLGYSCAFAQRRGAPTVTTLSMAALYALHPIFSVMALSMTKDTLFAAAILVLSLLAWELSESPRTFLQSKRRCTLFIFCALNAALMRNNGLFALALLLPSMVIVASGMRKHALLLAFSCAAACFTVSGALTLVYQPETMPSFQMYSLPAQQLVRACSSEHMSESDRAEVASWYTNEAGMVVHPHLADGAKGYLDRPRVQQEGEQFLALWKKHLGAHAHEYLEAFLMLNVGSWYPDDLSHSTIYLDGSWNDKGYLQTQEFDMTQEDIKTFCFLPRIRHIYEQICRRNDYQEYPVISLLFGTATSFWILALSGAILLARHQTRYLPMLTGCLGLWLSYLFGPCTLPRYMLPLFCLAPAALCLVLSLPAPQKTELFR